MVKLFIKMIRSAATGVRTSHKTVFKDVKEYFNCVPTAHSVMLGRPLVVTNAYIYAE